MHLKLVSHLARLDRHLHPQSGVALLSDVAKATFCRAEATQSPSSDVIPADISCVLAELPQVSDFLLRWWSLGGSVGGCVCACLELGDGGLSLDPVAKRA